ncbi:MAG: helix-turn-helix transcriptional regulator [Clostridia bacterium]|nr:helix-turn-helix transcriptional regulator [Clostridia bacterium]MBQ6525305.1 helix-turn-helix transcriptional regulator [Clostridia bacterium]
MNDIKDIFAKNLSELRQASGMTQLELGERLNYSDKTVSKWERGESIPDAGILKQIADVFGVTVDYLLDPEHGADAAPAAVLEENDTVYRRHMTIRRIVQAGVWLLSVVIIVLCWIVTRKFFWLILIWTLPVSFLLSIIFTSLWSRNKGRDNYIYISLFIFSILLAIYLSALKANLWMLFLIMIPVEVLMYFCFKLYFDKKKRT